MPARCTTPRGRFAASRSSPARTADAVIETPAPDPWSLPVRAISSLYTHHAMDQINRRVRVRGTVTGTRVGQPTWSRTSRCISRSRDVRHSIYIRDETSAALIETEQPFELSPGDVVEVAGFPIVSSTKPRLHNARHAQVERRRRTGSTRLSLDTLLAADHDSELVRVEAVLLAEVATPTDGRWC